MVFGLHKKHQLPNAEEALPGRKTPMPVDKVHFVNGNSIVPPYPEGIHQALFGLGCFWGAEKKILESVGSLFNSSWICRGSNPKSKL